MTNDLPVISFTSDEKEKKKLKETGGMLHFLIYPDEFCSNAVRLDVLFKIISVQSLTCICAVGF